MVNLVIIFVKPLFTNYRQKTKGPQRVNVTQ